MTEKYSSTQSGETEGKMCRFMLREQVLLALFLGLRIIAFSSRDSPVSMRTILLIECCAMVNFFSREFLAGAGGSFSEHCEVQVTALVSIFALLSILVFHAESLGRWVDAKRSSATRQALLFAIFAVPKWPFAISTIAAFLARFGQTPEFV